MNAVNHDFPPRELHKPLLFISHKHSDHMIANVISAFVRTISGGGVDVHQSSNPQFEGPRVGKELAKELEDALWRAGIVLMIYTSQDQDWSWCMWECGVALEPSSPDTKVVVLQCLRDEPQVFKSNVHVLAWDEDSIISFAKRFRDPDFFPNLGRAITGLSEKELEEAGKKLYKSLRSAIPQKQRENWNAWPYLRIQIPRSSLENLNETNREKRFLEGKKLILEEAIIIAADSGLPQLFRLSQILNDMPFKDLVKVWREHYTGLVESWLDVLVQQVISGAFKQTPDIVEWHRFRHIKSNEESIIGVGRIKGDCTNIQFDLYFFGVASIPIVSNSMNTLQRMYYIDLARRPACDRKLLDILSDLEIRGWSRLPILEGMISKGILHVSDIDRFIRRKASENKGISNLTLADLMENEEIDLRLSSSWETISEKATLWDAKKLMSLHKKCQDLIVTATGKRDEPVLGWITDRDISWNTDRDINQNFVKN